MNNLSIYLNAIISAIFSFILTIVVCDRSNIDDTGMKLFLAIINYIIIVSLGSYIIEKLKK